MLILNKIDINFFGMEFEPNLSTHPLNTSL